MYHKRQWSLNPLLRGNMHTLYVAVLFAISQAQMPPYGNPDGIRRMDMYQLPVPFGHIHRDGFGDPNSDLKQPIDMLELRLRPPKNKEEVRNLLKNGKKNQVFYRTRAPRVLKTEDIDFEADTDIKNNNTGEWPEMINMADLQIRNAMMPPRRHFGTKQTKKQKTVKDERPVEQLDEGFKRDLFKKNEFVLSSRRHKVNWTTCDEFGRGAFFYPRDIVDIEWVPFYVWSLKSIRSAVTHRFSYPTKKLVKQYYDNFHLHLNNTVDWQQPKLLMTEMNDILLIAVNKRGLFRGIPRHSVPSIKRKDIVIPTLDVRLKIDDPYLVMMFCDDYYATIMAVAGDEPATYKDKIAEAATIGFKGTGRPIWRNMKDEKAAEENVKRQKVIDEESKIIKIHEEVPPMF